MNDNQVSLPHKKSFLFNLEVVLKNLDDLRLKSDVYLASDEGLYHMQWLGKEINGLQTGVIDELTEEKIVSMNRAFNRLLIRRKNASGKLRG